MNHLLSAGLLRACLAVPLRPAALAGHEPGACRDAAPGEWCHAAVTWAKERGYERRPDWFPGDASQYTFGDFQALLHQLGEAECPRPCPADAASPRPVLSLLQLRSSPTGRQGKGRGEAERREARGMASRGGSHGLRPEELAAVAEAPWRSVAEGEGPRGAGEQATPAALAALAAGENETESEAGCQDAQPGSMCRHAATWLHDEGLAKHPKWYPSLSVDSTVEEVQHVLHDLGKAHCPRPCRARAARRLEQSSDDRVLEVDGSGRQVLSTAYELSGTTGCGDVVEGDWCYISIMWLKNTGMKTHPDWYPQLTGQSGIVDFQTVLHNEGKVGCPLPCVSAPAELPASQPLAPATPPQAVVKHSAHKATPPQAVVKHSAHKIDAEPQFCKDAPEGSTCYKAVTRIINVGLKMHPEEYPELAVGCSRQEVQEHLYLRRRSECERPCPERRVEKQHHDTRVKKSLESMTVSELTSFLNGEWDGYVDADEYMEGDSAKETLTAVNAVRDSADDCRDASVGDQCHEEVIQAQTEGILEHPNQYPGLSKSSTFKEFQAFLHNTLGSLCQMPCPDAESVVDKSSSAISNETDQGSSETQDHSAGDECHDATVGDLCHKEVTWAQTEGIVEHPKWYPGLSTSSTFKEFQAFVHETRGGLCKMPCPEAAGRVSEEPLPLVNGEALWEPSVADGEALPLVAGEERYASAEGNATADAPPLPPPEGAQGVPSQEAAPQELAAHDGEADASPAPAEPVVAQPAGDSAVAADAEVANDTPPYTGVANGTEAEPDIQDDPEKQIEETETRGTEAEEPNSEAAENDEIAKLREENARLRAEADSLRIRQEELAAGDSAPEAPSSPQADADTTEDEDTLPVVNGDGQETLAEEAAKILLAAKGARAAASRLGARTSPAA